MSFYQVDLENLQCIDFKELRELADFIDFTIVCNINNESKLTREWWIICAHSYFKTISGEYSLPIKIRKEKKPKPDFWVHLGKNELGIETTFCSEEKYEQAKKICTDRNDGSYPINTSFMRDIKSTFDNSYFKYPDQPLHGMPIYGNYSSEYTIRKLIMSIDKKVNIYRKYAGKYALAVYVNLPSNGYINDHTKMTLGNRLANNNNWDSVFKSIEIVWSKDMVSKASFHQ